MQNSYCDHRNFESVNQASNSNFRTKAPNDIVFMASCYFDWHYICAIHKLILYIKRVENFSSQFNLNFCSRVFQIILRPWPELHNMRPDKH
jgi:hypothetical protein